MNNNDNVTLTFSQLKKLVTESKNDETVLDIIGSLKSYKCPKDSMPAFEIEMMLDNLGDRLKAAYEKESGYTPYERGEVERLSTFFKESDDGECYAIVRFGGSIGAKYDYRVRGKPCVLYKDGLSKEEAQKEVKEYRKMLSPGERKYYGISYSVVPCSDLKPVSNSFETESRIGFMQGGDDVRWCRKFLKSLDESDLDIFVKSIFKKLDASLNPKSEKWQTMTHYYEEWANGSRSGSSVLEDLGNEFIDLVKEIEDYFGVKYEVGESKQRLNEWEEWVDDNGYSHDDEGNVRYVGKSWAGGVYGLHDRPHGSGYYGRRNSFTPVEKDPNDKFLKPTKDGECPKCGRKLVKRNGKFGEFYSCPGFPRCSYSCNKQKYDNAVK